MRRTLFYLSVALLAFGIGSLFVFKIYWLFGRNQIITEDQTSDIIKNEEYIGKGFADGIVIGSKEMNNSDYVPKIHVASCNDKNIQPVWNELLKDEAFQESAERFYDEADCSKMLHIQKTDLNNDGRKEIILSGNNSNLCDAAFNCWYWIFERKENGYKQILRSSATGYREIANYTIKRGIEISKTKSNGYQTVILRGGANYQTFQYTSRFEKNRYIENECLTFDYIDDNENWTRTCEEAWKE